MNFSLDYCVSSPLEILRKAFQLKLCKQQRSLVSAETKFWIVLKFRRNADHDSDLTSAFIYFRQNSKNQHKFVLKSVKLLEPSPIFIPSLRPLLSSETQYKIVYGKLSYQKGSFERTALDFV